jgi:hypothetical protein
MLGNRSGPAFHVDVGGRGQLSSSALMSTEKPHKWEWGIHGAQLSLGYTTGDNSPAGGYGFREVLLAQRVDPQFKPLIAAVPELAKALRKVTATYRQMFEDLLRHLGPEPYTKVRNLYEIVQRAESPLLEAEDLLRRIDEGAPWK